MTNREWREGLDSATIGGLFCDEVAKDGGFCLTRCPFKDLCVGGENGFEVWLNKQHEGETK